jgi:nucleoside-diphosphate-sugar epimerase
MNERTQISARVLVTGASGFIGTQVLDELTERGIEVHALGRNVPAMEQRLGVVWHRANLIDMDPMSILMAIRPSHCIHLAWEATPGLYRTALENYDWVTSTIRLARAFYEAGGQSFTMAGSCAEYALPTAVCDEFNTRLAEDCAYTACKVGAARILTSLARSVGARFISARIFYIYGPGEPTGKLVASICRALTRGQAIPLTSGADVVDYIFSSDVAQAIVSLSQSNLSGAVNIGTGRGVLVRDLATRLGEIAGRPELLQFGQVPLGRDPVTIVAAIERLTKEVGYRPAVTLDQGLRACYGFWSSSAMVA